MSKQTKNTGAKNSGTRKEETTNRNELLFGKENYLLMLASVLVITIGFWLMAGDEDIFSTTKITVAPLMVLAGFVIGGFAIFYRKKQNNGDH